jgi:LmbE family N-acetylglucosaminyl deacetylase
VAASAPKYVSSSRMRSFGSQRADRSGKHLQNSFRLGCFKNVFLEAIKNPVYVSQIRVEEDTRFCKLIGANLVTLDLRDASLRRPPDHPYIPKLTRGNPESLLLKSDLNALQQLKSLLTRVIKMTRSQIVASKWPYGNYQHLDHWLCYNAAVQVASERGLKLLFLDDEPYSRRPITENFKEPITGIVYQPQVFELDSDTLRLKYKAISVYNSQVSTFLLKNLSRPPQGGSRPSETLWIPKDTNVQSNS